MKHPIPVRQQLQEQAYANVPIDISKADMHTAIEQYTDYLTLDESYHAASRFLLGNRGDGDYGQFTREIGKETLRGKAQDNKDIFHFGSMSRQVIESRISGRLPKAMQTFLNSAEELFWSAERSKRDAVAELDVAGSGLLKIMQPETAMLNDVLRFIAYYPGADTLAKGHFDRSTATLALGESHEGLRMTPGQNARAREVNKAYMQELQDSLEPVTHHDGEAKFFLGAGWNRLQPEYRKSNENLQLAWHDVVSSDQTVNDKIARWAIVLFANPNRDHAGYEAPSTTETRPYKSFN